MKIPLMAGALLLWGVSAWAEPEEIVVSAHFTDYLPEPRAVLPTASLLIPRSEAVLLPHPTRGFHVPVPKTRSDVELIERTKQIALEAGVNIVVLINENGRVDKHWICDEKMRMVRASETIEERVQLLLDRLAFRPATRRTGFMSSRNARYLRLL